MRQVKSNMRIAAVGAALLATATSALRIGSGRLLVAANAHPTNDEKANDAGSNAQKDGHQDKPRRLKELMQARFPQPVKVNHLIGLPILDSDDSTIGYVQTVVRSPDGKNRLVVPYGKRFGWACNWWPLNVGRRLVAVTIEVVGHTGSTNQRPGHLPTDFDKAPTWSAGSDQAVPFEEQSR